jgi:16S rRNA (uracil1498-N3)-methyltransferase
MRESWLYCPTLQPGRNSLSASESQHAAQSLRLRPSDTVTLFDGLGHVGRGVLVSDPPAAARPARSRQRKAPAVLVDAVETVPPPARTLTLIVPGCKGPRLDWLIEKGTELGVSRFILADFERSVVHVGPQHVGKLARTAIEACKQCHRARLPQIETVGSLAEALRAVAGETLLVAHMDAHAPTFAQKSGPPHLAVAIGPEGGLSPPELDALRAAGGQVVRLAEHVLRVETAALTVAAQWAAAQ